MRPQLHRLWAFFLILLHVANYLILGVAFFNVTFLLALFLIGSPFAVSTRPKEMVFTLPWVGPILMLVFESIRKPHRILFFHDPNCRFNQAYIKVLSINYGENIIFSSIGDESFLKEMGHYDEPSLSVKGQAFVMADYGDYKVIHRGSSAFLYLTAHSKKFFWLSALLLIPTLFMDVAYHMTSRLYNFSR
jgi:hypothetical protein